MDYLRTLGSAAVSTLVQKSGLNLPFSLGAKVTSVEGLYTLYDGLKRDDGSNVSIFEYDFNDSSKKNLKAFAQNSLRKLRTTRHPDVVKFMDAVETDTTLYIMTERVKPLQVALATWSTRGTGEREDWLLWGLHKISIAVTFINDACASTHGKICPDSIFISPSGEWKLGGFELLSSEKDDNAVLYSIGGLLPGSASYASPEIKKGGWSAVKGLDPASPDAYALGLLLHTLFNPSHPPLETAQPPHPPPSASSRGSIPTSVFTAFKRLLNPNPKNRLSAKGFLELGMNDTGFFATNRLVKVCLGLDNFSLGSEAEKNSLLRMLKDSASSFPPEFASFRVLPSLLSALEFGGASAAIILPLVLQFGTNISPEDYPNLILAPIIKLFGSSDRGTRMALLDHLPEFVDKLDKKSVSDKIFPNLQTGFSDTVAVIREATIKSIILLSPKLNDRILNTDLLRLLAKTQVDPEPSIRTNTCILIGRLGPSLGYNTKRKVLVPAFSRSLKDPFVHARVAGLMAFMATIDCFDIEDIATKVIPNISFTMIDSERLVRDQAFKAVDLFVKRLESHASSMPETTIVTNTDGVPAAAATAPPVPGTLVNSAAGAAGALAGWAISSLGKKLATSDLTSTIAIPGAFIERPTSAPIPSADTISSHIGELRTVRPGLNGSAGVSTQSSPAVGTSSTSHGKGLQLGANKVPLNLADSIFDEETKENEGNPWGNGDLIDVNADQDDWSAFESAPTITRPMSTSPTPTSPGFTLGNRLPVIIDDPWNDAEVTKALSTQPRKPVTSMKRAVSPPSRRSTPISPSRSDEWNDATWDSAAKPTLQAAITPSVAGMTKEEKAAEMLRRKEERKQRIALLKEQKKSVPKT